MEDDAVGDGIDFDVVHRCTSSGDSERVQGCVGESSKGWSQARQWDEGEMKGKG